MKSEAAARRRKKRNDSRSAKENAEMDALRRGAISAFILFHLVAIACVAIPAKALSGAKDLFMPYMRWSGLFQSWDMFAPEPQSVDSYVKAVVITREHHIKVWSFPRMEELSLFQKFRKERYRKLAEVLPQPEFAPLWPDVASHVARFFANPADPPEKIMLIQFQSETRPPTPAAKLPGTPTPTPAAKLPGTPSREPEATPRPNVFYDDYLQPGDVP
jgi:hypothetical protein